MRICNVCREEKPLTSEHFSSRAGGRLQHTCRPCAAARQKARYNADPVRHRALITARQKSIGVFIDQMKTAPCADCDGTFPPICMDFDHLSDKDLAISHMRSRGMSRANILAEMAKCELVCANCHRIRTQQRYRETGPV